MLYNYSVASRTGRTKITHTAVFRPKQQAALSQPGNYQSTGEVTGEVKLLKAMAGEMSRQQIQHALGLKHEDHFRKAYLLPALKAKLIEMTIPDKPHSKNQRYRLTPEGSENLRQALES